MKLLTIAMDVDLPALHTVILALQSTVLSVKEIMS